MFDLKKVRLINTKIDLSLSDGLIYKILVDKNGNTWVETNYGLNLINKEKIEVKKIFYDENNVEGLCNITVTDIYEDLNGNIWIGTTNGLNVYNYESGKFKFYSKFHSLYDYHINAIKQTKEGIIYFTTFKNLLRLNPKTDEYTIFDYSDGLLTNEFSSGVVKLKDGTILFGGTGVINIIKDSELSLSKFEPNIGVVSIKVEGKELKESELYYNIDLLTLSFNKN